MITRFPKLRPQLMILADSPRNHIQLWFRYAEHLLRSNPEPCHPLDVSSAAESLQLGQRRMYSPRSYLF